ncbi:MAG: SDR family NAD(P)-dependent oxidoreductase [Salinirussus sp.]
MSRPLALVTGGSGGIGRAIVEELSSDHDIAIHYHSDRDGAESAAAIAADNGADTCLIQANLADRAAVEAAVDEAIEFGGGLDVLVNNAGLFYTESLLEISPERIETTMRVNAEGTIWVTRAALPALLDDGGHIVTVSSRAGTRGSPTDPTYGASKAAVIGLTQSIALNHTEDGIFANVVAPGAVDTKMFDDERRPARKEASPISRLVKPDEVAEAVRFFAETAAISGRVLEIDGGAP